MKRSQLSKSLEINHQLLFHIILAHSEAMSSILLNLQKVTEPTITMLQTLINCECKLNDPFVSSILRYWSMKTDVHDLARMITSLVDVRPPSPPVKRKGLVCKWI